MPELPEVESVRRQLAPELSGRRVVRAWWDPHPHARISGLDDAAGQLVRSVERRGKFLICPLDPPEEAASGVAAAADGPELELVLHLGMTGSLRLVASSAPAAAHERVGFELDDGRRLAFNDPRRFGRASVVRAGCYLPQIPTLAELGPEPLSADFDPDQFATQLSRTRAPVKARLLDQRLVAGVGNIYADEALWRARIHPGSRRVGRGRALALHAAVREVLAAAVEREGTTFRDYQLVNGASGRYLSELDVYGRGGQDCRRCGAVLRRIVLAQRGTTYCPRCQRI